MQVSKIDYSYFNLALVEDDPVDADYFQRILKTVDFDGVFHHFRMGEDLLAELNSSLKGGKHPTLDLIFLDIGLPGMNGKEVLQKVRNHSKSRQIPIIILSGSNSERDYIESIEAGCNGYLVKSHERDRFSHLLITFLESWACASRQKFV